MLDRWCRTSLARPSCVPLADAGAYCNIPIECHHTAQHEGQQGGTCQADACAGAEQPVAPQQFAQIYLVLAIFFQRGMHAIIHLLLPHIGPSTVPLPTVCHPHAHLLTFACRLLSPLLPRCLPIPTRSTQQLPHWRHSSRPMRAVSMT